MLLFCLLLGSFLNFTLPLSVLLFSEVPLLGHLHENILVVLGLLEVSIGSSASHSARVVLGSVLGGVVCSAVSHWHHTDVLHEVLLAHEIAHVVLVSDIFLIVLLLLLDLTDLRLG